MTNEPTIRDCALVLEGMRESLGRWATHQMLLAHERKLRLQIDRPHYRGSDQQNQNRPTVDRKRYES